MSSVAPSALRSVEDPVSEETRIYRSKRLRPDRWGVLVGGVVLLISLPLLAILVYLTQEGPEWSHLVETVLPTYISNTLILVAGVSLVAILFSVLPAYLVSYYEFPGRRLFQWALILPLALPTYVAAFVFFEGPEAAIPFLIWIRSEFGVDAFLAWEKVIRYGLLILMMGAVLSPYLFVACRATFQQQTRSAIEAARCLGMNSRGIFFRIALPLARPAMVGGLALIVMEVINDYGAVHFFGVPTLTEGIFRTWFGMGDRVSALRLAGMVMVAIALLLILERQLRGKARFEASTTSSGLCRLIPLSRGKGALAILICLVPLVIGFIYPVARLSQWAALDLMSDRPAVFAASAGLIRGLVLALGVSVGASLVAAVFFYAVRLRGNGWRLGGARLAGLGYATPGAVIALGVLAVLGAWDRWAGDSFLPLLSGTLFAIGFAYFVRFFAIPLQFSRSGLSRIGRPIEEAARLSGKGPAATFGRIHLPLLRGPLIAAGMLLFVDILKELPLTLILRPANFETLATSAYSLAKEARLQACAVPSLLIVIAGGIGLMIMNRWMSSDSSHD